MSNAFRVLKLPALLLIFSVVTSSCHVGRYFYRNTAGVKDHRFFPSLAVQGNTVASIYPVSARNIVGDLPAPSEQADAEAFLKKSGTTSFLLLKNDSLVIEWYGPKYDRESITPSFSVAKSVVSTLIGIAIAEGSIPSLDSPVYDYLGNDLHPSLRSLSFRHLLDMRAGLNFRERYYLPFSPMARYYYGRHLDRYVRTLKAEVPPGQEYEYQSAATQLAGMALERATGKKVTDYLSEKIWIPAGMQAGSSWSTDRQGGDLKLFCCLNTYPIDLIRFGALFVEGNNSSATRIIPEGWTEMILNTQTPSKDSQGYPYTLGWRVTPGGGIFAKGVLGQYIYVNPAQRVVIVRTGKSSKKFDWGRWFDKITK